MNPKKIVELFDGNYVSQRVSSLPESMKKIVSKLNGQHMTLDMAVEKITPYAEEIGGTIEVVGDNEAVGVDSVHNHIDFHLGSDTYWLFRYKEY